jgi:hypothetical protein
LRFAEMTGVRPMIEKYPLEQVNEASADGEREGAVSRGAHRAGGDVSVKTRGPLHGVWISH